MPQELYCEYMEDEWSAEREQDRNPCQWFAVVWKDLDDDFKYKRPSIQELDDLKKMEDSFVDLLLRLRASTHEAEPPELEAEFDESGLELRCVSSVPARQFQRAGERVQLSRASAEFSQRARGLPLVIVSGEEEAE